MGLFSANSPFDGEVEKATDEKNTVENWGQIMEICDSVGNSKLKAKDCLKAIVKRLNAQDPHIVMQAITLLDACSSNCGKNFHLEIASRDFEAELKKLLSHPQQKLVDKTKILLKKWSEGDFKVDPQLNLIPSLYNKLKNEGLDFSGLTEQPKHACLTGSAVASKEEQDIAKAIELSLKENKQHSSSSSHGSPASGKTTSLYPNVSSSLSTSILPERRKVRALYDFEAAEDNELSFTAGDIIHILDDSDPNWWTGVKGKMEGLFPASFVTADLSVEPEHMIKLEQGSKKSVQFAEEVEVKSIKREPEVIEIEIDESKIDRLLHLLHEADPQSDKSDPPELLDLEEQVTAMGPLINAALEKVDRRHAQLTQLSSDLVDALNLYHTLMREPITTSTYNTLPKMSPHMNIYSYPTQFPPMYNGIPPPPPSQHHPSYNPAAAMQPGPYNTNMSGMPSNPNDYMAHHNIPGITMPQYNLPTGTHQHPPPSGHHLPGLSQTHSSILGHPSGHSISIHPPASLSVQQSQPSVPNQNHLTGPPHPHGISQQIPHGHGQITTTSQPQEQQTNVPYQPQGFPPQGAQIPVQYVPLGTQVPHSVNQQPQYAPQNGQHMM